MHESLSDFLEYIETGNENTYGNTKTAVNHFVEWIGEKDPREIDALEIESFARNLNKEKGEEEGEGGKGLAEISCIRYVICISNYFEYMKKKGEIVDNPVHEADVRDQFESSRETKRSKELRDDYFALSPEDMKKMIENVPDPVLRNQLIFKILGQTGCRPGELCSIRLKDITEPELWDNNRIRIRASKTQNNRTVRYNDSLRFYLRQWIHEGERDAFYKAGESEYLFPTHRSEKISTRRIQEITRQTAKNADLHDVLYTDAKGDPRYKVTAYAFRHGYAENMIREGCDLARLKKLMGHSDISMTQKYLDPDETALDETTQFVPDI